MSLKYFWTAYLSAHGGIDKKLMNVMKTTFSTRFGPRPFSELLAEMCYLEHASCELTYFTMYAHETLTRPLPPVNPFSAFGDKLRYAGTAPSSMYCKATFTDFMNGYGVLFDRVMASLPGTVLKSDHTFKVSNFV